MFLSVDNQNTHTKINMEKTPKAYAKTSNHST